MVSEPGLLGSFLAVLVVVLSVELLTESLLAVGALEKLCLIVHLGQVLLQIRLLGEGLTTMRMVADEWALLGVRAQVVEELEDVRDHAVAAVLVLALEEAHFDARRRVEELKN